MDNTKVTNVIDKRRYFIFAVAAFVICFLGVVSDNDVMVVDVLALVTGLAIGLSAARTIRRARDRNSPGASGGAA